MRLKSLEYLERVGEPEEWTLTGLSLGEINLLVGKNASGKSRILNVIHNLAQSISEQRKIFAGNSRLIFDNNGEQLEYVLEVREDKVVREIFTIDGKTYLDRGIGGVGKIAAVKLKDDIDFQTPDDQLAVVARRDSIQHPYFEPLHQWANSLYY
jgi:energy-coupling factor transporter ATP-binding protein EcfA2